MGIFGLITFLWLDFEPRRGVADYFTDAAFGFVVGAIVGLIPASMIVLVLAGLRLASRDHD